MMNRTGAMMPMSNASRIHTIPSRKTRNRMWRLTGSRSSRARRFSGSCTPERPCALIKELLPYAFPLVRRGSPALELSVLNADRRPICFADGASAVAAWQRASPHSRGRPRGFSTRLFVLDHVAVHAFGNGIDRNQADHADEHDV